MKGPVGRTSMPSGITFVESPQFQGIKIPFRRTYWSHTLRGSVKFRSPKDVLSKLRVQSRYTLAIDSSRELLSTLKALVIVGVVERAKISDRRGVACGRLVKLIAQLSTYPI